jgi:hypothetical protein
VQSNYEDAHLRTQGRKVHRRRVYSLTVTIEAGLKLYGIPKPDGNGGGVFKEDGPEPA